MPHVILKLASGRSEQTKMRIAEAVAKAIVANADCEDSAVSVSIEDVAAADWTEKVYKPDILGDWDRLYKKPGYSPK
jgi:4-oxalocrotonate tautomerase